ncbi:MAG: DNA translocase FtsK 4TM domain-containing protein [Bacteroidetes bacterium]|nr:DNA translocase FtsK 4TM domain-containing protein [Bacteroidota bacterium]MBS1648612.1 DNA translocase FtsK 4TM domain-containing protein [Bacteroidota bacterium]
MANKLKKKIPPTPSAEELNPDKEVEVTVTEVVKDERTTKILGAISLLFALFLFIAFTSYLFTWQDDQDKVHQFGIKIFTVDDVKVNNLLGVLGAYIAHLFIYKGFGIASFLFCTFFFVLGVNLMVGKKIFSLARNLRYVLIGLLVISVTGAFAGSASSFSWGGASGELINAWLIKWIGSFGTGAVLYISIFSYIIWRFNPTFKWPERKIKPAVAKSELSENELSNENIEEEEANNEAKLFIDNNIESPTSTNKLKNDGKAITVLMPDADTHDTLPQFDMKEIEESNTQVSEEINEAMPLTLNEKLGAQIAAGELNLELENSTTNNQQTTEETQNDDDTTLEIKQSVEDTVAAKEDNIEIMNEDITENIETDNTGLEIRSDELATINYDPTLDLRNYKYPELNLLETHGSEKIIHDPTELETNKNQIIATLKNYDISIQRIAATVGPTVTLYEIVPAPGVRISRIKNLEDDIALSLAALGIRIIAPIPGKGTVGIEVPNVRKTVVSMKTLLGSDKFQNNNYSLPIALGKKIDNENFIVDLAAMPHLLMAGATGQGKSVGVNAVLVSLLYKKHPSQLKFVLVDPKKVELSLYRIIEKHFLAKLPGEEESIITDTKKVVHTLNALCIEMDNRYDLLKEAGCRNIREYNEKFVNRKLNPQKGHQYLPFIVLVIDEFADLIMTAGKEIEMPIARLAQLARAIGIHLIIATQRPSVNIITGTIKANFPARIAFKVSSKIDSRTILDTGGAEQLIGKGDMLISYNGEVTRLQCAFVDTPEVERVAEFIGEQKGYPDAFLLPEYVDEKEMEGKDFDASDKDPLFEDAAKLIVQNQIGSTSLIQRRMKLGYNRAGRLMDQLENAGIVGPNVGSKAREVRFKTELELNEYLESIG